MLKGWKHGDRSVSYAKGEGHRWECVSSTMSLQDTGNSRTSQNKTYSSHILLSLIANYLVVQGILLATSKLILQFHFTKLIIFCCFPTRWINKSSQESLTTMTTTATITNPYLSSRMCFYQVHIYNVLWLNSITQIKLRGKVAVNKFLSCFPLKHQDWAVQRLSMVCQMQTDL